MVPIYLKFLAYINLLFILVVAMYIAFSKNKGDKNSLHEKFSKKYYLKNNPH